MAIPDQEFPTKERLPREPELEFRQPHPEAEHARPLADDFTNPEPAQEFTAPGSNRTESEEPTGNRRRRLKRLLKAAAALLLTMMIIPQQVKEASSKPETEQQSQLVEFIQPSQPPKEDANRPTHSAEPIVALSPNPTMVPVMKNNIPVIEPVFFSFSHEHYGIVLLSNTEMLRSVEVSVQEKVLGLSVYQYTLTPEEIKTGRFELPMLSSGDYYMEHREELDEADGWPEFEMTVTARYQNEAGEDEIVTLTKEAEPELGIGISYLEPNATWSEDIPVDSFYLTPWEETDNIRYVINDPDAVVDPNVFSVDLSWDDHHAVSDDYTEIIRKDAYEITDPLTGESGLRENDTKILVLRRPDWMPEKGILHVHIVQRLATTGELWIRDFDYAYSPESD